jgi:hypothetical protein
MATTTTNFGWDIPQSTDLVKDGATAIAALGQDIDTALVDLKGGTTGQVLAKASGTDLDFSWVAQDDSNAIQNAIVDAKGDLIGATAADTPARLAVGANGTVLTADSTAATGLAWAAPASGSLTLLSTTSLTGAYTLISTINQSYKNLYIEVSGVTAAAAGRFRMWPNDTTTLNGNTSISSFENISSTKDEQNYALTAGFNTSLSASDTTNSFAITWYNYASTTERKPYIMTGRFIDGSATGRNQLAWGAFKNTTAISSFRVDNDNGNLTGGTVRIYGVN